MKKKNVLFFIYQMGGGGAARTLLNIINNLDRSKFNPILVTLNYNGAYEHSVKSDVVFIKLKTKRLRNAIFPLAKLIRSQKADIVFSTIPNYNTIALLGNMFSFTRAKNIVREADNLCGSFVVHIKLLAYGIMYRFAHQVISLSKGVKENLMKRYKVKGNRIEVIYNPIDLDYIHRCMEDGDIASEHEHLFKDDVKTIITAGRLVKQKDHRTMLHAFTKVNKQIPSRLVILGEGELEGGLKQLTRKLHIEDNVYFIGFQHNPYIYFKHADLFVLSSIHEGFGHVLAEALASGIPVVSTNCKSGPEEVLGHGQYGALCEVGNVDEMAANMIRMLTLEPAELSQVIERGCERAEDFNARKIVKAYEEMFLRTLGAADGQTGDESK